MARVLVAARVRVAPDASEEWIATAGVLALRFAARGQHVWVFRHPADPHLHLEFREGASREHLAAHGAEERALMDRMASLGIYEEADVVWESVSLPTGE